MPIPERVFVPAAKDPGLGHFAVSIVKSIFRFIASGLMAVAGYILWTANEYTDIFIAAMYRQAQTPPIHLAKFVPNAQAALQEQLSFAICHYLRPYFFLPSLRKIYSILYMMPFPL